MNRNIIAAIIIAVGLVLAAFVHSGRYYILALESGIAVKVDRWTGNTEFVCTDEFEEACWAKK